MANIHPNQKNNSLDLVILNDILQAQVFLEEKARRDWKRKWGFLLDLDKLIIEEAARNGVSEEEYRRWTVQRKSKTKALEHVWDLKVNENFPKTSSGMIGWRHGWEYNLERLGPLYVSPMHTLPSKEHVSSITYMLR